MTLHAKMAYANMMRSGLTASRPLTKPFCARAGAQQLRRRPLTTAAFRRQFAVMAQATYDIWVKGSPEKNELGDCKYLSTSYPRCQPDTHQPCLLLSSLTPLPCWLVPEHNSALAGPFSHRMMMTMEEKGISYNKNLLDEMNMPDW